MAQVSIIFDRLSPPLQLGPIGSPGKVFSAQLSLPDELDDLDIYETSRRLAELLLEQIART